jgi:hypothetical protein
LRKKLLIIILLIAFLAEALFLFTRYIGLDKVSLIEQITKVIPADVEIKGDVKLVLSPLPKLSLEHVRIKDLTIGNHYFTVRAKKIDASISLLSLITGKFNSKNIIIDQGVLSLDLQKNSETKKQVFIPSVIKEGVIKNLEVKNSVFVIFNQEKSLNYKDVNLSIDINNNVNIRGSFASKMDKLNVNSNIKYVGKDLLTNIMINTIDAEMSLNIKSIPLGKTKGSVLITGKDIKKLIFNNLSSLWFFFPDSQKTPFEISFDFIKENKQLNILNGLISGDAIEGSFASRANKNLQNNLQIDLVKLDLNKFITNQKKTFVMEEVAYLDLNEKNIDLSFFGNEQNSKTDLILKSLLIKNHELKDLQARLVLNNKETKLDNLIFSFTGDDKHSISGYFDYEVNKYKFIGNHVVLGSNIHQLITTFFKKINFANNNIEPYKLSHSFEVNTDYLKIKKFDANMGEANILADLMFYFSEGMDTKLNVDINKLNLNNFILLDNQKKHRHLLHYIYDKLAIRDDNHSLLKSLLWLRNLYYNLDYKISLNNTTYNNHNFTEINLDGRVKYRELLIEKFNFLSKDNNFTGQIEVSLDQTLPFVNIAIDAIKMDLDFLNYTKKHTKKTSQWSKRSIKAPNLSNIELRVFLKAQSLNYNALHLRKSDFVLKSEDNVLFLRSAKGLIDQGEFDIVGKMILDGLPELSLSYNLTKFQIGAWINLFFGIKDFDALANWSGSLHSAGNTPHIMIKQLESKNKFNLADIRINKLAINKVNQEIANLSSNPQESFKIPMEKMIRNGNTRFSSATGDLNINKGNVFINNIMLNSNGMKANIMGQIDLVNHLMKLNSVFVFTVYYKIKDNIKKTAIKITHQLNKREDNISGKFNLIQLSSFIEELKNSYLQLYNKIIERKKLQEN